MASAWNVLVVDDEEDVHNVTRLALRRKTWQNRPITLTSARSGAQARELLESPDTPHFHCALVDVVMESDDAGLRLCDLIRATMPRTMRIILRTGQPGAAPAEKVMSDYDIDYYIAKTEVTEERLFMTLRACFRSSLDVAALLAMGVQLRAMTVALQDVSTTQGNLARIMQESLRFLEDKYEAKLGFVAGRGSTHEVHDPFGPKLGEAIAAAHGRALPPMSLLPGADLGLGAGTFLVVTASLTERTDKTVGDKLKRWFRTFLNEPEGDRAAGIGVRFERQLSEKRQREFIQDLELFVGNWRIADASLRLQDRIVRDRMEIAKNMGQT